MKLRRAHRMLAVRACGTVNVVIQRIVEHLVRHPRARLRLGEPPPVLLPRAGASVESGVGSMQRIFDLAGLADLII